MNENVPCLHNDQNAQDVYCQSCSENSPFLALSFKVADLIREKIIIEVIDKISWEWDRKKIRPLIEIVFNESLQNAVEHGILGIDFDSKNKALEESPDAYTNSVRNRWAKTVKPVTITLCINHERILLGFHDNGKGFNYEQFKEKKLLLENLLEPSGRGIPLLIGMGIRLYWNRDGNSVFCAIGSELLQPNIGEENRLLKRSEEKKASCTILVSGHKTKGKLVNHSLAGVEIRYTGDSLPVNTSLHIVSDKLNIDRYAQVIWCKELNEKKSLIGLKFI